ncbi:uncharacterized protein LOC132876101 [Neoarius graeffei]|uniref:uncharacterized protein LOC132876101 n=1 Tax=Neoarius graeffei TaxID=443677 RepID=UPI00298C40B6|nr:uncharacterized protein LOC132876101 [Neoarius graeffei]
MAEASMSVSQDQFRCPVCLDLLKDPVAISCGHSFCMVCINGHWDQEDQKGVYSCPQCRDTFTTRPVLHRNTMLAEVVEKLKKTEVQAASPAHCYAGPGDVECDFCTGRKHKAVKSCLMCLASFCEIHLKPHLEVPALKKHTLTEASAKLQEKICSEHNKLTEIYCRTDQTCICYLCTMENHKGHDTVTAAAERAEKQSELKEEQMKSQQRIQEKQKKVQELKQAVNTIKLSAQTAVEDSERIFTELISSMEKKHWEVTELIRDQEKAELSRAERLLEQLEQEIADLQRRVTELEQLSHTHDHIHFLQVLASGRRSPQFQRPEFHTSSVTVHQHLSFDGVRNSLSDLKKRLEEFCEEEFNKIPPHDGETEFFESSTGVLQGDTLAPFIFVIVLDYIFRLSLDNLNVRGLQIQPRHYDLALITELVEDAEALLQSLEKAAALIGLYCNESKTEYINTTESSHNLKSLSGPNIKRFAGHCLRAESKVISTLLLWNQSLLIRNRKTTYPHMLSRDSGIEVGELSQLIIGEQNLCVHARRHSWALQLKAEEKESLPSECNCKIEQAAAVQIISEPEPQSREDFLKYFCYLTLDPNTAHCLLILSEKNRALRDSEREQRYSDHPERFDAWEQVLCKERVSGRCYWEVEWSGYGSVLSISVSYKDIIRKGWSNECGFGGNNESWSLWCSSSSLSFWHNNIETDLRVPSASRIGVYVDHSAGTLSFYSVSDTMKLLHRVHTTFTQPLYAGVGFYLFYGSARLCDPE